MRGCAVSKDDKLFNDNRVNYKMSKEPYKGTMKWGISRHNKKYGYWNFVCYLESEDDFKIKVIDDIKRQKGLMKNQKRQVEDVDDDI